MFLEYKAGLDDAQALDALVACFSSAVNDGQEKERPHSYFSPLHKRLVLGTIIDRRVIPHDALTVEFDATTGA